MTYWYEPIDSHIKFSDADYFQRQSNFQNRINEFGYFDAPLGPTSVLYMGTCDIMSQLPNLKDRWIEKVQLALNPEVPLMSVGSIAAGLASMIRRLHAFIQNNGAPSILRLTVARFDGYEFVNSSGKCYNVNSRIGSPQFLKRRNLLTDEQFNLWEEQVCSFKKLDSENVRYVLEERFAFLELMCKAYNISLQWSFNLSDACIVVLHNNIDLFKSITPFMQQAFVGCPELKDNLSDRSMGIETHSELSKLFISPKVFNFDDLKLTANNNYQWLKNKYSIDLIKNEN